MINYILVKITKIKNAILKLILTDKQYAKHIGVRMGKNCAIHKNIEWGGEPYLIKLGDNCRVTQNVKFITHDGGVWVIRNKYSKSDIDMFGKIEIGNNVYIGWNCIILPGVTIGDNCIIGSGSIVTKSIESNSVVVGIPARKIETIDEYDKKNRNKYMHTKMLKEKDKKKVLKEKFNLD